jgi:hypothetical protein
MGLSKKKQVFSVEEALELLLEKVRLAQKTDAEKVKILEKRLATLENEIQKNKVKKTINDL